MELPDRQLLNAAADAVVVADEAGGIVLINQRTEPLFGYTHDDLPGLPLEVLLPERVLRDSEEGYRALFENASDLIQSVKSDGSFIYVNPAWLKTLGYAENDLATLNVVDVIHPDDRQHCLEIFNRVNVGAYVEDIEAKFVTKSGDIVLVEGSASSQREDGEPIATRAIFHDVTIHKKAEEALKLARDRAENATATKSRFLVAASHDLRQPLQSIGLYLSVLNRQEAQSEQGQEISNKIRSSLDVMGELLDALLNISQLDSGSVSPSKKDFSVQVLLDQIVSSNELSANEKGLALHCENSPCVIYSDPALLERVVENFVTNAIRYTDAGHIEVNCVQQGDRVRIEVKDTGVGMPTEVLETIFEEYFQLDNPVRDRGEGQGLGLAIVKHIARLLEHPLDVQSTPGEGSVFAVEVPIGQAIEAPWDVAPTTTAHLRQCQPVVLFVDDDPAIVEGTTMLLESAGIQVHTALDGEQALAHIEAGIRPDLMISDYRLPGDNGVEVVRRVRRAMAKDLPVLIMTGDTSGKEIEDANLTACTVLHKPADSERLISLVENLTADSG